jgi:hypothetical protein
MEWRWGIDSTRREKGFWGESFGVLERGIYSGIYSAPGGCGGFGLGGLGHPLMS